MIGKVSLNQKQIKSYLENYYKQFYEGVKIDLYDIDHCPNDTGIALLRNLNIANENNDLVIEEYLDNQALMEAFIAIFESEGYVVKDIYPDINRSGSGWSECVTLNSLNLTLEKENIKKRIRENVNK